MAKFLTEVPYLEISKDEKILRIILNMQASLESLEFTKQSKYEPL